MTERTGSEVRRMKAKCKGLGTVEQLSALAAAHADGDDRKFYSVLRQVASRSADEGDAAALRAIADAGRGGRGQARPLTPMPHHGRGREDLLLARWPEERLAGLTFPERVRSRLDRILREQEHRERLREAGLPPRRKLLMVGAPGCGKTRTAHAIAGELGLALYLVRLESLLSQYMGESSKALREVFDRVASERAVYLFDEFDSIGTHRGEVNDIGEIKRLLNTFLIFIEDDRSDSLILASTNNARRLDYALFRRFDDLLEYELPDDLQVELLLDAHLGEGFAVDRPRIVEAARGLSYSEILIAVGDARKLQVLDELPEVSTELLLKMLDERAGFNRKYVTTPEDREGARRAA